jgi:hypothetical protein
MTDKIDGVLHRVRAALEDIVSLDDGVRRSGKIAKQALEAYRKEMW